MPPFLADSAATVAATGLWPVLSLTLLLALAATTVLLLLGLPLAYWLNRSRFPGVSVLEALVALPAVLPSAVLGFYLLTILRPGSGLPASFFGLLVGVILWSLPFAVRPFQAALRSARPEVLTAARLDASPWQVFSLVQLPLAWPGILAGVALAFAHSLGAFGIVLMLNAGGAGAQKTTAPIALFDAVQRGDWAQAHALAAALLVVSFAAVWAVTHWQRRRLAAAATR